MTQENSYNRDIVMELQKANRLKAEGNYQEAVQTLQSVITKDPQCAPAYNNLGAIYYLCQDFQLAVSAYQAAINIKPDFLDAYYNLALAQGKSHLYEEAMITYRALLALNPQHAGAQYQIAMLYIQRHDYASAEKILIKLSEEYPNHFESIANLALCYLQRGRLDLAAKCYYRALEFMPNDRDILYNLGVIHMQQGYPADGMNFYLRAVKADPDYFEAHHNLAAAYLMRRKYEEAEKHFEEALRIKPDDAALKHTLQILRQDKSLTGSAPAYIQSLFDSYANYYEPHLLTYLHYQVPQKLHDALQATIKTPISGAVLDIGCGTGLCGPLFKHYATHLSGVDLSPNMLAIAQQKQIYDELAAADAIVYLTKHTQEYSLMIAADVLVYFGELQVLLAAASNALKPGGYFLFNVEAGTGEDFVITPSGRFAHSEAYLNRLAQTCQFEVVLLQPEILRYQEEQPVKGFICIWRRAS